MKRVLFILPSLTMGGLERVQVTLANALQRSGYEVTVMILDDNRELEDELDRRVTLFRKVYKTHLGQSVPYIRTRYYDDGMWESRATPEELYRYYVGDDHYDVEVAFFHGLPVKIISGSTNKDALHFAWIHNDFTKIRGFQFNFSSLEDVRAAYQRLDAVVCVSESARKGFISAIGDTGNTTTIYNILPTMRIQRLSRKEIAYRWEEAPVEGYVLRAEGNVLTNVHAPAGKTLTVIKIWDDGDDRDGIRPRSLTLTLTGGHRVTLNEENNWTASVADLPGYENGEEIAYSWSENTVSGYTLSSSVTEGDRTVITNRHETETTVAAVTKVWRDDDDRDGIRPESVTVTLSNGEKRILNAENGWTAAVTGLPVSTDGTPIEYRWTEEAVDGYTSAVTVNGTSTVFTNTHVSAAADLRIRKVWEDADDRDGIRPEEIAVTLLADGTPVFAAVLNEENHWSAAAENRPVYPKA